LDTSFHLMFDFVRYSPCQYFDSSIVRAQCIDYVLYTVDIIQINQYFRIDFRDLSYRHEFVRVDYGVRPEHNGFRISDV